MAINVIKEQKQKVKKTKAKGNSRVLSWLGQWFKVEKLIGGTQFPVKYLDAALFVLGLGLIVIFFRINAERQMRQMRKANEEVNNLRAAYTILKANYMKMGKQSELAPKVAKMGLKESRTTPQRIEVK
ncbi:MAG: FtsL-like putative cell division protein [Spirosomataceae bacterium]